MKLRSTLLILTVMVGISCSKNNDPVVQPPFLNAKAGGVVKDCNNVTVTLTAGILQINAQTPSGDAVFVLTINNYTQGQIGTFNIGPGNFTTALYREGSVSFSAGTSEGSGRIQITNSNSEGVQGSFEFNGVSITGATKSVTEGRFNAYF